MQDGRRSSVADPRAATSSLPRQGIVPLRSQGFARVYRTGTRSRKGAIVVLETSGADGPPRVGVVAGRKVGHAVHRNRAKRRMREAARRVDLKPDTDYVIVALPGVGESSFDDIVGWVSEALEANQMKHKGKTS